MSNINLEDVQVYLVGGSVRDLLLQREAKDYDYVVVGMTPERMVGLGFKQVGADFPVFLHPITGDEFALARTERLTGSGHKGFTCEWEGVTLEEDLSRRDLTINAMAMQVKNNILIFGERYFIGGWVIDPFNGQEHLKEKTLTHVSDAYQEDPLRVLRTARFAAELGGDWLVSISTMLLQIKMVNDGKLKTLTKERVWKETEKALNSGNFWKYIVAVGSTGYLEDFLPFINPAFGIKEPTEHHPEDSIGEHIRLVVEQAEMAGASAEEVWAALLHDSGKPHCYTNYGKAHQHDIVGAKMNEKHGLEWKIPNKFRNLSVLVAKYHGKIHGVMGRGKNKPTRAKTLYKLFKDTAAEKQPERFKQILNVCEFDAKGRGGDKSTQPYPQKGYLIECLEAVLNLDTKPISSKLLEQGKSGKQIGEQIRVAKIKAIQEVMDSYGENVQSEG